MNGRGGITKQILNGVLWSAKRYSDRLSLRFENGLKCARMEPRNTLCKNCTREKAVVNFFFVDYAGSAKAFNQ